LDSIEEEPASSASSSAAEDVIWRETVKSITELIESANETFSNLTSKQTKTLDEAATSYRRRRGRHPPPGFEQWVEYAAENNAIIVEDFFDQIYHDLEPFWGLTPSKVRARARSEVHKGTMYVRIHDSTAQANTDWFWHVIWAEMMNEVSHMLPDMIIPLNSTDEPRIMVSFEDVGSYIAEADRHRSMPDPEQVKRTVRGWSEEKDKDESGQPLESENEGTEWFKAAPYYFARAACPPGSPLRAAHPNRLHLNTMPPTVVDKHESFPIDSSCHLSSNWTLASDLCQDPDIGLYHGALTSPLTASNSKDLLPMFGGSKFAVNNDILLPAPMYWNGEERFDAEDVVPWSEKRSTAVWRGTATGGRHNALNWPNFHRHRFVALANGTKYDEAAAADDNDIITSRHSNQESGGAIFTLAQRQSALSRLPQALQRNLGTWLHKHNDVQFTDLFCDVPSEGGSCWYLSSEFAVDEKMPLTQQYQSKLLPDIDDNSFSGRYRSFLLSNSVPIKATLYREWHDSRLVAWKHFVPMNNRFTDFYTIMGYLVGCDEDVCGARGGASSSSFPGHDEEAEEIARAGSEWAHKVLRKVDMQIYIARLLLEYARLTDDDRDLLGWVDDLMPSREDENRELS
jgi:hypothetical protein